MWYYSSIKRNNIMSLSSKEINRDNLAIRVDLANILETKESLSAFSKEELTYIIILLNTLKDNYYELDNDSNDNIFGKNQGIVQKPIKISSKIES